VNTDRDGLQTAKIDLSQTNNLSEQIETTKARMFRKHHRQKPWGLLSSLPQRLA
jgi:hypothetical protein